MCCRSNTYAIHVPVRLNQIMLFNITLKLNIQQVHHLKYNATFVGYGKQPNIESNFFNFFFFHFFIKNICRLKHKSGMTRHMQQHMDSMNLHCSLCDKVVRNKLALRSHISSAHSGRRYQCSLCDKAFRAANSLKVTRVHFTFRMYVSFFFFHVYALQDHFATHTGEYLYNCAYCDKRFKSRPNMFTHRKNAHLAEWTRDKLKEVAGHLNT